MSSVLLTLFSELADRRRDQGKMYPLAPILLFTVLGMLAGARSYRQVHAFIRTHLDRLNSGFGLSLRRAPVRFILHGLVSCEEDKCRIRDNPGIMARARSFALNILRKNRVTNVAKALWDGAISLDHILAYKKI